MGLSSKQVTSSGIDWNQTLLQDQKLELPKPPLMRKLQQNQQQQQQQQIQSSQQQSSSSEPLKCPRCDSINTKFCYYNNYNKSQPRHFCRACKRHWTKGGTLRNVPVGGGRKNKRPKKSSAPISSAASSGMAIQSSLQGQSSNLTPLPLSSSSSSASLFQSLLHPPPLPSQPSLLIPSSHHHHHHHQNLMNSSESKDFGIGNCTLPLLPHQNQSFMFPPFSSSSSTSFETNPCSVSTSLRSSSVFNNNNNNNYGQELKAMEGPTPTQTQTQPWEIPSTSVVANTEMSNYWTWEEFDSLVSTDLNVPWDDSDLKP